MSLRSFAQPAWRWGHAALLAALTLLLSPLAAEESPWVHDQSDLRPDPDIHFGSLPNGFRYAILPHQEPPKRVSLRIVFQVGSLMEREGEEGIAHYLEHMAFKGTRRFPEGEMIAYLQGLGMAFGPDTNASTGMDHTTYMLELPDNSPDRIREGLELMRDYGDGILFEPGEIDRERGVILAEKQTTDSVGYRTLKAWMRFMMPETLFPERLPIGLRESILSFQQDDFVDFYRRWYIPSRTLLIVVGDLDPEEWEETIAAVFSDMDAVEPPPEPALGTLDPPGDLAVGFHREEEAPSIRVELNTIRERTHRLDDRASRELRILETLSSRILSRRLARISESEDAAFLSGGAGIFDWYQIFEIGFLSLQLEPGPWEEALETLEQEWRRALLHGFTEEEVTEAWSQFLNDAREADRRAQGRSSRALASDLASTLRRERVFLSPRDELVLVEALAPEVTADRLHEVFQNRWEEAPFYLFITGDLEPLTDAETLAREVWASSQRQALDPPEERSITAFPYTQFGPPATIPEGEPLSDIDAVRFDFANGIRLFVKQTTFEPGAVEVALRFGRGLISLPDNAAGLPQFAESIFIEGGLGLTSFDDLRSILAGRTVSASFGIAEDAFFLSGSTQPDELDLQLQLLTAYLVDPGYRPSAERRFRRSIPGMYRSLESTWQGILRSRVRPYLREEDHRFLFPEAATLADLELDQVRAWVDPQRRRLPIEIQVVGDIDPSRVAAAVGKTLGTLSFADPAPDVPEQWRDLNFPPVSSEPVVFPFTSEIDQAVVLISWPSHPELPVERSRRLSVLAGVLENRLRDRIRDEMGVAYSLSVWNQPSSAFDYGQFNVLVITDHSSMPEVEAAVLELAPTMHQPVDPDAFAQAQQPRVRQLELAQRDNHYWVEILSGAGQRPEQVQWAAKALADLRSVTPDDLTELAREILHPAKARILRIFSHPDLPETPESEPEPAAEDTP